MSSLIMDNDNDHHRGYSVEVASQSQSSRERASNSNTNSNISSSNITSTITLEGPHDSSIPKPPAGFPSVTSKNDTSMTITWSDCSHNNIGINIVAYVLEMKQDDDNEWRIVTDSCISNSYLVSNLSRNHAYSFRVRAVNSKGISEPSQVCDNVYLDVNSDMYNQDMCNQDVYNKDTLKEATKSLVVIEKNIVFDDLYSVKEELGRGRFGICRKVIDLSSKQEKAAKYIRCSRSKEKEAAYREIAIMNTLKIHPRLLQLENAYEFQREIILVTELISGGELFERVVADDYVLTELECMMFMRQICEGVSYMHTKSIIHLDLKPENVLCKTRTSCDIKIIDFGLAQTYNPLDPQRVLFGTPEFVAPEVIQYEPVSPMSDMWSVGVICYVLLSGLSPFMGDNDAETFANVTHSEFDFDDDSFDNISQDAKTFITQLLLKRPEKRMTADECLMHPWLLCQKGQPIKHIQLPTEKLKKFLIRRKWQKTGTAILALGRFASLSLNKNNNSTTRKANINDNTLESSS